MARHKMIMEMEVEISDELFAEMRQEAVEASPAMFAEDADLKVCKVVIDGEVVFQGQKG